MTYLTTLQAAQILGITTRRVTALIQAHQLPAEKFGRDYLIRSNDLRLVAKRKAGRPRKNRN
jgi:excisionase family DNA binding protein